MKFPALILTLGIALAQPAQAGSAIYPGIIIRPEDRFDPAIQRIMAEHSLRLLPLRRGQLYYLYPIGATPRFEGVQIRYLEQLLDKQAAQDDAEAALQELEEAANSPAETPTQTPAEPSEQKDNAEAVTPD